MKGASGFSVEDFGLAASYMPRHYSPVWKAPLPGWRESLDKECLRIPTEALPSIFFRADGVGAAGQAFEAVCRLFRHHGVPLALAVVPAWLSPARQKRLFSTAPLDEELWGWHQHGWRHVNWQDSGRTSEFGANRPPERQHADILQGRQKMEAHFGQHFVPIFTPPWNRFSPATVKALQALEFKGISTAGELPPGVKLPWDLCNFAVSINLHTREDKDPARDFTRLLEELCSLAGKSECVGIGINHQRMTPFAFQFLHCLLYNLRHVVKARFFSFREILNGSDEKQAGARLC